MPAGDSRRGAFIGEPIKREFLGETFTYYPRGYHGAQENKKFCGGSFDSSIWISRQDLIGFFERRGFTVEIAFEEPDHVNGPALAIYAHR